MEYIYAMTFSDDTVKFGRSSDIWRRAYQYDSEDKRSDRVITSCFICTVFDAVQAEKDVLRCASAALDQNSRESFSYDHIRQVKEVLAEARLSNIWCKMSKDKFGMVLAPDSFSTDFDKVDVDKSNSYNPSRNGRIRSRIMQVIETYSGPVTPSILKNRLLNYRLEESMAVADEMVAEGIIKRVPFVSRGVEVGRLVAVTENPA